MTTHPSFSTTITNSKSRRAFAQDWSLQRVILLTSSAGLLTVPRPRQQR